MMTSKFSVGATSHLQRTLNKLKRRFPEVVEHYEEAIALLEEDPYNITRRHKIKKLEGIRSGDGQYRLRIERFRFRYDIQGKTVVLHSCKLRREDTYR